MLLQFRVHASTVSGDCAPKLDNFAAPAFWNVHQLVGWCMPPSVRYSRSCSTPERCVWIANKWRRCKTCRQSKAKYESRVQRYKRAFLRRLRRDAQAAALEGVDES